MKVTFEHRDTIYRCDLMRSHSIGIPLKFGGPQPNHFGAPEATSTTLELGGFIGDTRQGGGCNVDQIQLIPHCNGTHTETVGHIVDDPVHISELGISSLFASVLISVRPGSARDTSDTYRPELDSGDRVITRQMILDSFQSWQDIHPTALVIRTIPNSENKSERRYSESQQPPFLTIEAMDAINDIGVEHLLLDIPSVDRMYDGGMLSCHHLFWNVPQGTHRLTEVSCPTKTITEMVVVPDKVPDGFYLLNLQIAAFVSDAAPSRPILFPATAKDTDHE